MAGGKEDQKKHLPAVAGNFRLDNYLLHGTILIKKPPLLEAFPMFNWMLLAMFSGRIFDGMLNQVSLVPA